MCTGAEFALIGGGLNVAGGITSVFGQKSAAEAQMQSLARESELGQLQAIFKKDSIAKQARKTLGAQKVAAAKSGVQASGSVMEVMRASAEEAELAALNAQYGADLASQAREIEAQNVHNAAINSMTSTLLETAGQAAKSVSGAA